MKKEEKFAIAVGLGLTFGIVLGSFVDNIGLWMSLGLAIGAAIGTVLSQKNKD